MNAPTLTATALMNCFNCGDPIFKGDEYARNQSGRIACIDCADSDDQESLGRYDAWAEFNGAAR